MLTGKQKRYLRKVAHNLPAIYQVGKDGVHHTLIEGLDKALTAKELVKIKILETCTQSKNEVSLELSVQTKSEIVQILGRTIILYRESDERIYKLP